MPIAAATLMAAARARLAGAGGALVRTARRVGPAAGSIAVGTAAGNLLTPRFGGYSGRRRRGRGITAAELRGARKVAQLVRMYGMKPKSGNISRRRGKCR